MTRNEQEMARIPDTRVRHCAAAENDDPPEDRELAIASRAMRAMRADGRDENGQRIRP